MCGIVGILGKEPVADNIVEALRRLEYRGYDSAGVATLTGNGIERRRAVGKLKNLAGRQHDDCEFLHSDSFDPGFRGVFRSMTRGPGRDYDAPPMAFRSIDRTRTRHYGPASFAGRLPAMGP